VFELGELARVRKEKLSALEEVDNVPLELAMGELRNALYPSSHAERHYVGGTEQSLRAVTRGDVLKFYREHYRPDSTLLALIGDFDAAEVKARVERLFGHWTSVGPRPRVELADIPEPDPEFTRTPLRLLTTKLAESIVVMGARGVKILAPDYFAALAANHILGGGGLVNSRLMTALREKRGLTYSVSSSFSVSRNERPWTLSMQCNPKDVDAAIAAVQVELKRIRSEPPTEDEMEQAAAQVRRSNLCANDVLIAVAASGTTPFTLACLREARSRGTFTVGIANNRETPIINDADQGIFLDTGAEPIAGSTRMNAGTAQRITLNLLSTLVMIRLGRVYRGIMVDVQSTNTKLEKRKRAMVAYLTEASDEEAREALERTDGTVKLAVILLHGCDLEIARSALERAGGRLRQAMECLDDARSSQAGERNPSNASRRNGKVRRALA
jgi:N-acetylmuramic acid 6-phosphate etherase